MRWSVYFLPSMMFIALATGCASFVSVLDREPHEVTREDADRIHPLSRHQDRHKRLTLEDSRSINRIYGDEISQKGDLIAYYNARWNKPLYPLTKGNIFLVHTNGEKSKQLTLLVCTTRGKIDEIMLKNNPIVKGQRVISLEFLQQFIGRSLGDSWEITKEPSDLLSLPEKIRPLSGYTTASEEIANSIRKVLVWAKVLGIE